MTARLTLSIVSAAEEIRLGRISPVDVVERSLARIAEVESQVQAFVEVDSEGALAAAREAEREIGRGLYRGPLHGIPVGVKDIYAVAGFGTGAGTPAFPRTVARASAAAVQRLQDAGAIVLGKTHTHELALGIMTPPTRNPWNTEYAPGGSSGGSAAAVAAGECVLALGSDTGGSIRGPASLCGVVGMKPTYGRVSRFGVLVNSWSLDTAGPLTRTVADAAVCMNALAGWDSRDLGSLDVAVPDFTQHLSLGVEGLTLGVPENYYFDRIDGEIAAAVNNAIAELQAQGARVKTVHVPLSEYYDATIRGIQFPEISAYHADLLAERGDQLTPEMKLTLEAASRLPARTYVRAQQARQVIKHAWRDMFHEIDALITPTFPAAAPRVDQQTHVWPDGSQEMLWSVYSRHTMPANITGLPAISVPCGLVESGLPLGLQVIGRPFDEATVLRIAAAHESASPPPDSSPPLVGAAAPSLA